MGSGLQKEYRMIILRIALDASPEKLMELKQALSYMISDIRHETSCSKVNAYLDLENENRVLVLSYWESREELDTYLRSDKFSALLGTRILLRSTLLAFIDKVATREGIETIIASRV
jgi:quinol monooxygenase YgiN